MVQPTVLVVILALVIATCSSFTLGIDHPHHRHPNTNDDHHHQQSSSISIGWGTGSKFSVGTNGNVRLDSSSSSTLPNAKQRQNKFQNGVYNKPIVLIGCRGAGDELMRLADSIVSTPNGEGKIVTDLETSSKMKHTIVPMMGSNGILTHQQLQPLLHSKTLDNSNVLVIDFDADEFRDVAEDEQAKLTKDLSDLAKALYEDEGILAVYVNVHPEEGGMSTNGTNRKKRLEEDVFRAYSDYEICLKNEGLDRNTLTSWSSIQWHLSRTLARASLPPPTPGSPTPTTNTAHLTMGSHTFFLSLSFPGATDVEPYAEAMCKDVDAMELRVDLLECREDGFEVLYGMQRVREMCRPYAIRAPVLPSVGGVMEDAIPVVYTVRTAHQAGTWPDDEEGIGGMFDLLEMGLRAGVEVLDVESAWDVDRTDGLLQLAEERYTSQILGSHHVVDGSIPTTEAVALFQQCALNGRADAAKVVLTIEDEDEDHQALDAAKIARQLAQNENRPVIPHIGVILGEIGQYSRTLNIPFTPVTHESLPFVAAPGQLSAKQLMANRSLVGMVPTLRFGILGHNIAYSVSPAMQGGGFEAVGLPHSFELVDVETVEEIVEGEFWNDSFFGGCCVTIPHKQTIIPYLDLLTDAAEAIGAVNTVLVRGKDGVTEDAVNDDKTQRGTEGRILVGDNTDWKGIFNPLNRMLGGRDSATKEVALILGGGGTARAAAYAATQLGLEKVYYNRTPAKADELAARFGGTVALTLDGTTNGDDPGQSSSLGDVLQSVGGELRVVLSTLPAAAEFELPDWIVKGGSRPIVFDVNYKPYYTKLLYQAEGEGFPILRGSEMLWEQGVGQFELWMGRTAPYKVMKDVVLKNCLPVEEK